MADSLLHPRRALPQSPVMTGPGANARTTPIRLPPKVISVMETTRRMPRLPAAAGGQAARANDMRGVRPDALASVDRLVGRTRSVGNPQRAADPFCQRKAATDD